MTYRQKVASSISNKIKERVGRVKNTDANGYLKSKNGEYECISSVQFAKPIYGIESGDIYNNGTKILGVYTSRGIHLSQPNASSTAAKINLTVELLTELQHLREQL